MPNRLVSSVLWQIVYFCKPTTINYSWGSDSQTILARMCHFFSSSASRSLGQNNIRCLSTRTHTRRHHTRTHTQRAFIVRFGPVFIFVCDVVAVGVVSVAYYIVGVLVRKLRPMILRALRSIEIDKQLKRQKDTYGNYVRYIMYDGF